ncbi:MAG: guanylate kinase [Candidatus Omnitrophica bacterium]|nr:guanylate kinase [Candidatus Omnitrophota bacterium]
MSERRPKIFILSGPGGAGKTTLEKRLFRKKLIRDRFLRGISFTTRPIRPGERPGRDYVFVSREEFVRLEKRGFFLESEKVLEHYYGTPRTLLTQAGKESKDLLLCIDVKGGMRLKQKEKKNKVITIFVSAPTLEELEKRLRNRVERKNFITRRIALAKKELQFAARYDYLVTNIDISRSLDVLEAILTAEQYRR